MNKLVIILLAFAGLVGSETINKVPCEGNDGKNNFAEAQEIRIAPCPDPNNSEGCKVKKGSLVEIQVEFFSIKAFKKVKAGLFLLGMPFGEIQTDACQCMDCPVKAGGMSTYNSTFSVKPTVPGGSYTIQFKLYDKKDILVCQLIKINVLEE